jgi:hypothetical protein
MGLVRGVSVQFHPDQAHGGWPSRALIGFFYPELCSDRHCWSPLNVPYNRVRTRNIGEKAVAMDAVWITCRLPVPANTAATAPRAIPQKARRFLPGFSLPVGS